MARTALLGAFGQGNFGDDWMLADALEAWPKAEVLARGTLPPGVRAGRGLLAPWALPNLVVLPGGALFQDRTSRASCLWYLAQAAGALARGARLLAVDMDLSELSSPALRAAVARLFAHRRARLLLRPGQPPFAPGAEGPDGVVCPVVATSGGGGVGWAPSPLQAAAPPPGADSLFLCDPRPGAPELPRIHRHRRGGVPQSQRWIMGLAMLTSARYHPLLLAWMAGLPGAGTGPRDGKVHLLCRRAGYPFFLPGDRPRGPRPPARSWQGRRR